MSSAFDYRPNKVDAYVNHLAEVNKTNNVVATADLYNEQGVLLARKGTAINARTAERLIRHKLNQPLEQVIALESSLDSNQLIADIEAQCHQWQDLDALSKSLDRKLLKQAAHAYLKYPVLVQKVTVLKDRLPDQYAKSLFCAWFGLAIADKLCMSDMLPEDVFIAGLVHDVGMLHIDPEIVNKQGEYTAEEWRAIQCHVLVGKLFLETVDGLDNAVPRAVAEHHERCDGSGYPFARIGEELSSGGQVVAMADMLYAMRTSSRGAARDVLMLLPVLQVNDFGYHADVYDATRGLIRNCDMEKVRLFPQDEKLLERLPQLCYQTETLRRYSLSVGYFRKHLPKPLPRGKQLRCLSAIAAGLDSQMVRSGMNTDSVTRWVTHVHEEKLSHAYEEMEEYILMCDELVWRFREFRRRLKIAQNEVSGEVEKLLEKVDMAFNASNAVVQNAAQEDLAKSA
ncbi:HD-GYP domain-containing protein [Pokkaliibacter sp. CJK22405]|uniref:HD-GYP domain-containing protein n=1 Tax=Pokkaliibacter sp. CJK22405 TaxID=3384615 RepID=UPI003984983C